MTRTLAALAFLSSVSCVGWADEVTLAPAADNSMYFDPNLDISNGVGEHLFAGRIATGQPRRSLVRFDLSSIPAGSTITSASLKIYLTRSVSTENPWSLHRVTAEWGEGASDAGEPGGRGAASQAGDASWHHRIYDTAEWATPGGDYVASASTSAVFGLADQYYAFPSSAALVADLQGWLDAAIANYGWIVMGDESDVFTAGRFSSSENLDPAQWPALTIVYDPPAACPGDLNGDESVNLTDLAGLLGHFGVGSGATLADGDLDGDEDVDLTDLAILLANFGTNC